MASQDKSCIELALKGIKTYRGTNTPKSFKKATKIFETALRISSKNLHLLSSIHGHLGNVYFFLQMYDKARLNHQNELYLCRQAGNKEGEMRALGNLGNSLKMEGCHVEALRACSKQLQLATNCCDEATQSKAFYNLACIHLNLALRKENERNTHLKKALEYLRESLKIAEKLKDLKSLARNYGNIANVHYLLGEMDSAIYYYQNRLSTAEKQKDKEAKKKTHFQLGNCFVLIGHCQEALEHYSQSLKMAIESKDKLLEAKTYHSLGHTHTLLGHTSLSLSHHQRHLILARHFDDKIGELRALLSTVECMLEMGESGRSMEVLKKAQDLCLELQDEALQKDINTLKQKLNTSKQEKASEYSFKMENVFIPRDGKEQEIVSDENFLVGMDEEYIEKMAKNKLKKFQSLNLDESKTTIASLDIHKTPSHKLPSNLSSQKSTPSSRVKPPPTPDLVSLNPPHNTSPSSSSLELLFSPIPQKILQRNNPVLGSLSFKDSSEPPPIIHPLPLNQRSTVDNYYSIFKHSSVAKVPSSSSICPSSLIHSSSPFNLSHIHPIINSSNYNINQSIFHSTAIHSPTPDSSTIHSSTIHPFIDSIRRASLKLNSKPDTHSQIRTGQNEGRNDEDDEDEDDDDDDDDEKEIEEMRKMVFDYYSIKKNKFIQKPEDNEKNKKNNNKRNDIKNNNHDGDDNGEEIDKVIALLNDLQSKRIDSQRSLFPQQSTFAPKSFIFFPNSHPFSPKPPLNTPLNTPTTTPNSEDYNRMYRTINKINVTDSFKLGSHGSDNSGRVSTTVGIYCEAQKNISKNSFFSFTPSPTTASSRNYPTKFFPLVPHSKASTPPRLKTPASPIKEPIKPEEEDLLSLVEIMNRGRWEEQRASNRTLSRASNLGQSLK